MFLLCPSVNRNVNNVVYDKRYRKLIKYLFIHLSTRHNKILLAKLRHL